jgi:L-arabonate dehydrase
VKKGIYEAGGFPVETPEELAKRRIEWKSPEPPPRGWYRLFFDHVLQADQGVDLDFLVGQSGAEILRHSH